MNNLSLLIFLSVGHLCSWKHQGRDAWEESVTFQQYRKTLYKDCNPGKPGFMQWTVAQDTPDLVYYQV